MIKKLEGNSIVKKKAIIAGILGIVLIIIIVIIITLSGRMTATTMKIKEIEGSVSLTDDSGKELTAVVGGKLKDGNILDTNAGSKAVVSLDTDRFVYMLEFSRARFNKYGKAMKLNMEEGSTFFYIADKLKDDESLEIETTTMSIGIRGTSGYILANTVGPESVTITSGIVSVYCNKTDENYEVTAGQKMSVVQVDGEWIVEIEEIDAWSLTSEAIDIINKDGDLLREVINATGWSEEDLTASADGVARVAVPETVVDGVLHHAYYNIKPSSEICGFLDPIIEACGEGTDSVIALNEQYSEGDHQFELFKSMYYYLIDSFRGVPKDGEWFRFVYDDYRICIRLMLDPETADMSYFAYRLYLIPENGMGYYVSYDYIDLHEVSKAICGSCPCTNGMFEGEMNLKQHLYHQNYNPSEGGAWDWDYDVSATVKNGLVNGSLKSSQYYHYDLEGFDPFYEYIDAEFENGVYVSGTIRDGRTDDAMELGDFLFGDNYMVFGSFTDGYWIFDDSNECYPY